MAEEADVFVIGSRQKVLADELEQAMRNFSKDSASRKTQRYKEERLERIEAIWKEFHENHERLKPIAKPDTPYMALNTYKKVEELYIKLRKLLEGIKAEETSASTSKSTKGTDNVLQSQRLRKLNVKIEAIVSNIEEFEDTFLQYSKEINDFQQKILLEQLRNMTELHEEFMSNASDEDLQSPYVRNKTYNGVKKDINNCLLKMASTLGECQSSNNKTYSEAKLPPLKIPTFKGNYLEWRSFHDIFLTIIHNKPTLNETEKMEYLKTHLEGEPMQLIQHFTISSANYLCAWETLKQRYDNERKIVSMHIDKMLKAGRQGNQSTANLIKAILDATKEGLAAIKNMGFNTSSWDPIIVHLISNELDAESRNLFEQGLDQPNKMPSLQILYDFLARRYQALEVLASSKTKHSKTGDNTKPIARNVYIATKPNCVFCQGEHNLYMCRKFMSWTPKERFDQAKLAKICINCLRHDKQSQCMSKHTCKSCNKKHHTLLHMEWTDRYPQAKNTEQRSQEKKVQVNYGHQNPTILLATAIVIASSDNETGQNIRLRALIDPGSQATLITESVVQALRLNKERVFVEMSGLGASESGIARSKVNFTICPRFSSQFKRQVEALVLPKLTKLLPATAIKVDTVNYLKNLQLADPSFDVPGPIDMIIGADIYGDLIKNGLRKGTNSSPIAQSSELGWLITGPTSMKASRIVTSMVVQTSVEKQLERFWEIEELPIRKHETKSDQECERIFQETHYRNEHGRYVVKLPFDKETMQSSKLGESRSKAIAGLRQLETRFTSDIQLKEDQDYQRILWRSSTNQPIKEYKMTTVTYGTASAPYLAVRTLQQLASDEQHNYPIASDIVKNDFYVDDVMSGDDTLHKCHMAQSQLTRMLAEAGFNLRKWATNNSTLLDNIPFQARIDSKVMIDKEETVKTLGIHWNPTIDSFQFKVNIDLAPASEPNLTKRKTLSEIAKLYDPLGWLAPVTVSAKILMQHLWKANVGWDEPLPAELYHRWNHFKEKLIEVEDISIPRWLGVNKDQKFELHGFCDASEAAYAAVVYSRIFIQHGTSNITLLTAKTRVAPIKRKLPLPKLELCGAHLLSKLMKEALHTYGSQVGEVFAWTDSTITLAWIKKCPSSWKTFVANRVSDIHQTVDPKNWRHVSSTDNPADCASRGLSPNLLKDYALWWNGPVWLKNDELTWPRQSNQGIPEEDIPEKRRVVMTALITEPNFNMLERFSCYNKLLRVTAYCRRFVHNCRKRDEGKQNGELTAKEVREAQNSIIRTVQRRAFQDEIACLQNGKQIDKKSKILSLTPHLNKDSVLVVGGRLESSNLLESEKHRTILPHNDHFTKLLVDYTHKRTLHGGIRLTLSTLRQSYWIIQAKRVVRQTIHNCVRCHRFNAATKSQLMGTLPAARVTPSRPFTHTGIDYAGPIQILVSKGRGNRTTKGYVAIFVCLATKAIHIELVSDLTSEAFLAAVRRFSSRRGMCSHFYSDNGTTFVGANKEIQTLMKQTIHNSERTASRTLVTSGIQWHFIPPAAPHFGGLWEAGVKSMKYHLKRVIGDTTLTFEELTTLLTQIEACLNSRPLTALSNDIDDTPILTPGHFLVGSAINALPEPILDETRSYRSRWRLIQKITQDFWKIWSTEYLSQLQQRTKWKQKEENVKVGDIVLIKEDRLPPTSWLMGRISEIHPGKDDNVRAVTVFSNNKFIRRPVNKLCPLPIESSENGCRDLKSPNSNLQAHHVAVHPGKAKVSHSSNQKPPKNRNYAGTMFGKMIQPLLYLSIIAVVISPIESIPVEGFDAEF